MANGHVCLAGVMQVTKICSLVSIHQSKTMKPFNSVCCESSMIRDVILWSSRHAFQKAFEPFNLSLACEAKLAVVWGSITHQLVAYTLELRFKNSNNFSSPFHGHTREMYAYLGSSDCRSSKLPH